MVRGGIGVYGIERGGGPHLDRPLRPAMKWTAPLVGVSEIAEGESVGYGQTWRAPRRGRIGLVPVGYADGYPRCFSNRASVMVQGQPAAVVEEVTLLDNDPLSPASVYHLAKWAETIPYEILSRIGPRVKRVAADTEEPSGGPMLAERDASG